jgi:hypothetical protein
MRWLTLTIGVLAVAGPTSAQTVGPTDPAGAALPGYNRQTQPLSPYLNLLRGQNTAVNYYYGVRPGSGAGYQGMMSPGAAGPRQTFFPVVDTLADLLPEDARGAPRLPPTGHPVGFNNTMGYFGPGPSAARLGQPRRR